MKVISRLLRPITLLFLLASVILAPQFARGEWQAHQIRQGDGKGGWVTRAAENLSKHEETLSLDGVTELSDAAAESLGKHDGYLKLDGLASLSDLAAESLSKHKGDIRLSGLTGLSDAAAEGLSKHTGWLWLNGLTSLSDVAAESLSKHEGSLSLDLDELPDSAAEILRQHPSFQEDDDDE